MFPKATLEREDTGEEVVVNVRALFFLMRLCFFLGFRERKGDTTAIDLAQWFCSGGIFSMY